MEMHLPVDEFNAALLKRFQEGKIRNVYPLSKYRDIIEKIKSVNENPPCNIPGEYYLLRKFVVQNIAGKERLSCKQENSEKTQERTKFYVALEEIFEYLDEAHKIVKHGCRDRIVKRIQTQGIVNITRETVELFLSYCKLCRPRKLRQTTFPQLEIDSSLNCESNDSNNLRETESEVISTNSSNNYVTKNSPNSVCSFKRGFIDLIDFSNCPDGDYRFIFLYIDLQSCFCMLYPSRCKCKYEFASHLMSTFALSGPPQILHSDFDNHFLSTIIQEIKQYWPDVVLVAGSNVYPVLQEVAQKCIVDITLMLKKWMQENNSSHWSFGMKVVQLKKNTKLSNNGTKCPYECFFGKLINSSNFPSNIQTSKLKMVEKEEDLLALINEQNYSVLPYDQMQVFLDPNVHSLEHSQQSTSPIPNSIDTSATFIKEEPLSESESLETNGLDTFRDNFMLPGNEILTSPVYENSILPDNESSTSPDNKSSTSPDNENFTSLEDGNLSSLENSEYPHRKKSYTAGYKLQVVAKAEEIGNRAAGLHFQVDESCIRRWRSLKEALQKTNINRRANRKGKPSWPALENSLSKWVRSQRECGLPVPTFKIKRKAMSLAQEMGISAFQGGASWLHRFMKRNKLLKTSHVQKD